MHARVTTATFQRDKLDEVIRYLNSHSAELRGMKGFHNILFLTDRATGKSTIITLWNSEEDLKAGETSGYYQARMAELAPFATTQPTREVCSVALDDIAGLTSGAGAARTVTLLAQPGKVDEIARVMRESILPAARQQPGYRGLLLLLDRGSGKCIASSQWTTAADLKATETGGYFQAQIAKVQPYVAGQVIREEYELTLPALTPAPITQTQPHAPAP